MQPITEQAALEAFCAELRIRAFVAVDTEFMRERTYWPVLCLVQAAAEGIEATIDPLAPGLDLAPFHDVLSDPNIVKVFHAARQDVEIFYHRTGRVPAPMFDTQIAAMACGFGDQIGYEPLMRSLLGAAVDKGSRFTDWSRRPLTEAQLAYALSDVIHLREAYPLLADRLDADGRRQWVEEEMAMLSDPALYSAEPASAWRRLKLKGVRGNEIGPIVKLAEWREREAQARDVPRGRVLKDDAIYELARLRPRTPSELARARTIPAGFERSKSGAQLIEAIAQGVALPRSHLPNVEREERRAPVPPDVIELLRVLLKSQCERFHVAPKLIASASEIEALAADDGAEIPAMHGWRRQVFGELALRLKRGEIALRLSGEAVEIVDLKSTTAAVSTPIARPAEAKARQ